MLHANILHSLFYSIIFYFICLFLAHLSTTCSTGALRGVLCASPVVRRRQFLYPSSPKPPGQLGPNLIGIFLERSSLKIVQRIFFPSKLWLPWQPNGIFKQFFENILLLNCWSDCEIITQECSLGDPFQNCLRNFDPSKKHGCGEWGLNSLYGHEEN